MLFMVIEHFKDGNAEPVYRRFKERGRLLPDGLVYKVSWTSDRMDRCFQLMESEDASLVVEWTSRWADLVDFEIVRVLDPDELKTRVGG
jgi:Domain of unknown function (DUF3303)